MKLSLVCLPEQQLRKNLLVPLLSVLYLFVPAGPIQAQSPFLNNTLFTLRDGLSNTKTSAILVDADGFLWVGAEYGLNRYDGARFTHFNAGLGPDQLRGQYIRYMLNWDSLHILVGTDLGLSCLNIRNFKAETIIFKAPSDIASKANQVHQILRSSRGGIWVVTTVGVYRLSDKLQVQQSWFFPRDQTEKANQLESSRIWELPDGTVWVNGPHIFRRKRVEPNVIFEIDPVRNTMTPLENPPFTDQKRFLTLRQLNDTLGFVVYENMARQLVTGLFDLKRRRFRPVPCRPFKFWTYLPFLSEPEPGKIGMSTYYSADGETYAGATDYYLLDWRTEQWTYWKVQPSYLLREVVKTPGGLYFATSDKGLVRGSELNTLFERIPALDSLTEPLRTGHLRMVDLVRTGDKTILVGNNHGLFVQDEKTGECRRLVISNPVHGNPWLLTVFPMNGDTLLVAGEGLYELDMKSGHTWSLSGPDKPGLLDSFNLSIFRDSRGHFWMSNTFLKGLLRYEPVGRRYHRYDFLKQPVPMNLNRVNAFAEDRNGNILMGGIYGGGLLCWMRSRDSFLVYYPDLDASNSFRDNISDMVCDDKGRIWMGTEGYGVFYFHPQTMDFRSINMTNGLPNNYVNSLGVDSLGHVWVGTAAGLCRVDPETGAGQQFFPPHGIPNNLVYKISRIPGDPRHIFIGTEDGYCLARIDRFFNAQAGNIIINSFRINGEERALPSGKILHLGSEENNLEIDFSHVNLLDGNLDRYEYRFGNQPGSTWTSLGSESFLRLTGLGPGNYDVQVRVCVNGGYCFERRLVQFHIDRPFTQTPLFFALFGLLLAAPVFVYARFHFRLRLATLEQERERDHLRNRIAQDIHDEVGGRLTKISLAAQVAARLPDLDAGELQTRLTQLGADARLAAAGLKEIVFAINPDYDRFSEMQAYFREVAREFWRGTEMDVTIDFPENTEFNPPVPPDVKRHLLLLYKEALNNAAKHSGATAVYLRLAIEPDGRYSLEIRDNGGGFDPAATNGSSQGLTGMRKRAEMIGAVLTITGRVGEGAVVRVEGVV